ncbi:linker for activation of T-cells family member 1 isoform X2 [Alligator mississippiensis]|uniref:linker for activation of T-cells family member 1 isoform X2 n=1 Tax=Alligator mississippiensis TaxID=8496 RepID=UPI002877D78F|nr:linker for activation of T-cells family member 1 isoform X2 [Alligator mississippiensis]
MEPALLALGVLALLPPVAALLCAHCPRRSPRGPEAIGDYEYKPPAPCAPQNSFILLSRSSCAPRNQIRQQPVTPTEQFLSIPRSPQAPPSRTASVARPEPDNDSVPSYENEEHPPHVAADMEDDDNDYNNDTPGYVVVLPDGAAGPPLAEPPAPASAPQDNSCSAMAGEDYENFPEPPPTPPEPQMRESLADSLEYVNMPEPGAPEPQYGSSDRESEEDGPDYENLQR